MNQVFFWRLVAGYVLGILVFFFIVPFFLFVLGATIGWGLFLAPTYRMLIFLSLAIWGMYWVIWSAALLLIEGGGGPAEFWGVAISPRTKQFVAGGPYGFVRHPMAMGMLAYYLGLCFIFNSLLALLLWFGLALVIEQYLIRVEEKKLLLQFGQAYQDYIKKTPALWMWGKKTR